MKCMNCGESIPDDSRFCPDCGTMCTVRVRCAQCGQISEPVSGRPVRFCLYCGSSELIASPLLENMEVAIRTGESAASESGLTELPLPKNDNVRHQADDLNRLHTVDARPAASSKKKVKSGCKTLLKTLLILFLIIVGLFSLLGVYLYKHGSRESMQDRAARRTETAQMTQTARSGLVKTVRPTQTPAPTRTPVATEEIKPFSSGGVDPDLKAFLDEYESFMNGYAQFMKTYSTSGDTMSMLTQYLSWISQLESFSEKAERYESKSSEMSAADLSYYLEVMGRINQKLWSSY